MNARVDINETYLTVADIAERLKVNEETARRLFLNEPGVIVICCPRKGRSRLPDAADSRERLRARCHAVHESCLSWYFNNVAASVATTSSIARNRQAFSREPHAIVSLSSFERLWRRSPVAPSC